MCRIDLVISDRLVPLAAACSTHTAVTAWTVSELADGGQTPQLCATTDPRAIHFLFMPLSIEELQEIQVRAAHPNASAAPSA